MIPLRDRCIKRLGRNSVILVSANYHIRDRDALGSSDTSTVTCEPRRGFRLLSSPCLSLVSSETSKKRPCTFFSRSSSFLTRPICQSSAFNLSPARRIAAPIVYFRRTRIAAATHTAAPRRACDEKERASERERERERERGKRGDSSSNRKTIIQLPHGRN